MNQSMPALYFGNIMSELPALFKIGRSEDPIKRILDESKETMCISPNYFKNNVYILYLPNTSEVYAETEFFRELDIRNKRRQEEGEKENKEFFYTSKDEILEILEALDIDYKITTFIAEYDNLVYNEILEKTIHDDEEDVGEEEVVVMEDEHDDERAHDDYGGTTSENEWVKFYSKCAKRELIPLSNFHPGKVVITHNGEKREYKSGEAAFHGEKFYRGCDSEERKKHASKLLTVENPLDAKRMGGKGKNGFRLSDEDQLNWNKEALKVQREICLYKLENDVAVQKALKLTQNRPLLHQDNRANKDCIWGGRIDKLYKRMIGNNQLGKMWEDIRSECSYNREI